MSSKHKKIKSIVKSVVKEVKAEPPDKSKEDEDLEDGEIRDQAIAEIDREARIAKIRGETFGTWHCPLRKTNKTFLNRAIAQTLSHNRRESERYKDKSYKKLDALIRHREKNPVEKYEDGRHLVRNPFVRRIKREMGVRYANIEHERHRNYRRKLDRLPPRDPPHVKFVKPKDLDDRVLIPGDPKKAKVKKISFVAPADVDEKYLGHDGRDLHMERIRQKLNDKIPKQVFVLPTNQKEHVFKLSGDKVAGLIRACDE